MKLVRLADTPEEGVSHDPEVRKRVLLRGGDVPHLTNFSQATFPPGTVASAHAHTDLFEVFFIESGSGEIRVDGSAHPVTAGSCVVVHPGEPHEISNDGPAALVITYIGIRHP